MGYFIRAEFARIEAAGAYWLSRIPIYVMIHDSEEIKLETLLKNTKSDRLELTVTLGESVHQTRLIAQRTAPEIASKRRHERRAKARELGEQRSKDMLIRDGWYILATNVENERMTAEKLFNLYSIRWQIEITFRAWKQSGDLVSALARKSIRSISKH
jgi:Transposase DDE domain